jgi:hypothetical protein
MFKTTQKELREQVRYGAIDLTNEKSEAIKELQKTVALNTIAYSCGVYGCNGYLLEDKNNKRYVIIGRVSNMFLV